MITEGIISVFAGIVTFIAGLMPEIDVPGFVGSIASQVATVTGFMAPMGAWVPFGAAGNATSLVLLAVAVALVVRLVRIVVSLFAGGGGGAA